MSLVKMSDEHFEEISLVDEKFLHSSVISSKPRPMLSTIYLHLHIVYFSYNIQFSALLQKIPWFVHVTKFWKLLLFHAGGYVVWRETWAVEHDQLVTRSRHVDFDLSSTSIRSCLLIQLTHEKIFSLLGFSTLHFIQCSPACSFDQM